MTGPICPHFAIAFSATALTYLHANHLGTPIRGTHGLGDPDGDPDGDPNTGPTDLPGDIVFDDFRSPFGLLPDPGWGGAVVASGYSSTTGTGPNCGVTGFTTHVRDCETGLTYMQARYYSADIARFGSVDPVTFLDTGNPAMFNRYAYVENDPINMIDPFGLCGNRYDDGSCKVEVDPGTGQEGIDAGKQLESGLNELDTLINDLDPAASFDVTNSDGDSLGSFTGEELQDAWNNQEWSISGKDHGNGGLGGTVPGSSVLQPDAVIGYAAHASAVGQGSRTGVNTLISHEMGHAFGPGLDSAKANPVIGGQPNPISERGASAQGRSINRAIGKGFSCSTPGPYGC